MTVIIRHQAIQKSLIDPPRAMKSNSAYFSILQTYLYPKQSLQLQISNCVHKPKLVFRLTLMLTLT